VALNSKNFVVVPTELRTPRGESKASSKAFPCKSELCRNTAGKPK
jgi:hypothetical protein